MNQPEAGLRALDPARVEFAGELVVWTPQRAEDEPHLVDAIKRFVPIDKPAGHRAARWLREDALTNDRSTKTHLLLHEGEVQGFFACCADKVELSQPEAAALHVPFRRELPAFLVAWIARSSSSVIPGINLMMLAYGLALETAEAVGMVAFVLDPADDEVAKLWEAEPYGFRRLGGLSAEEHGQRTTRLWLPLG